VTELHIKNSKEIPISHENENANPNENDVKELH
jgi:hypothetical protein